MILWEGPSLLDDAPIVVIATGLKKKSRNRKTGAMAQIWILRQDMPPTEAMMSGEDFSICGDCTHRRSTCYVNVGHAPQGAWKAYKAGSYPALDWHAFHGKKVRLGAYGDPAAVPPEIWERLTSICLSWTGYTHQWKRTDARNKQWLMASVDTLDEASHAQSLGWRTFRVGFDVLPNEISCPASKEAGEKVQCFDCTLCQGRHKAAKNITIQPHGKGAKKLLRMAT